MSKNKLVPVDQGPAKSTAQVLLSLLSDERVVVPSSMLEGVVSGKSLLRGIISGNVVICQYAEVAPPPENEGDEGDNNDDSPHDEDIES